ncbi:hypothetical protein NQZ68_001105 [Dissostichus eleginoides]|nr:hypothetical protein NQZ68_001105 [Dissostichus eleginoides]
MMKRMMRAQVQIYSQPPAFMMRDRVELVEEPAQLAHTSAGQEQEVGENYPLNSVAFSPGGQGKPGFPS